MIEFCFIVILMQIFAHITEAADCIVEKAKEVETKLKFRNEKGEKSHNLLLFNLRYANV